MFSMHAFQPLKQFTVQYRVVGILEVNEHSIYMSALRKIVVYTINRTCDVHKDATVRHETCLRRVEFVEQILLQASQKL